MSENCRAFQPVPVPYGPGQGQLGCGLPMSHQGALHFDRTLAVWWMRLVPGTVPEDLPPAVRMNEDMPAVLQGEWNHA